MVLECCSSGSLLPHGQKFALRKVARKTVLTQSSAVIHDPALYPNAREKLYYDPSLFLWIPI